MSLQTHIFLFKSQCTPTTVETKPKVVKRTFDVRCGQYSGDVNPNKRDLFVVLATLRIVLYW